MRTIELTPDQAAAYSGLLRWAENEGGERVLAGLAGTGKTTLVSQLIGEWEAADIQVLSPTGKAASVLRSKGIDQASTIHSWLYNYLGSFKCEKTGRDVPQFTEKGVNGSGLLLIVDEASMVNASLANDLRKTGGDILWVGDHGQLEPVGANPRLMHYPDFKLETIVRQGADSGIVDLAHKVRRDGCGQVVGYSADDVLTAKLTSLPRLVDYCIANEVGVIICGYNKTRLGLNRIYRSRVQGSDASSPLLPGDRIVCLLNDYRYGVFNGECFTVAEILSEDCTAIVAHITDDAGTQRTVRVWRGGLGKDPKEYEREGMPTGTTLFDYGWALTAHKSQGSEWESVAVVWQPFGTDARRWGYTAITRAKKKLIIGL